MFTPRIGRLGCSALAACALFSCATSSPVKETNPHQLLAEACAPGATIKGVHGNVYMRASSPETSGQFPATVEATAPSTVRMEITNLIGGTEAIISVQQRNYRIEIPGKPERTERGSQSWGGIPLQWASDLFLGKVPCPAPARAMDLRLSRPQDGELHVEVPPSLDGDTQVFIYRFRLVQGRPWPESLHWERKAASLALQSQVDFRFDDPDPQTRSPLKWEAKSARGEVKVRWKDRELR